MRKMLNNLWEWIKGHPIKSTFIWAAFIMSSGACICSNVQMSEIASDRIIWLCFILCFYAFALGLHQMYRLCLHAKKPDETPEQMDRGMFYFGQRMSITDEQKAIRPDNAAAFRRMRNITIIISSLFLLSQIAIWLGY